jgi:hypothetical protein
MEAYRPLCLMPTTLRFIWSPRRVACGVNCLYPPHACKVRPIWNPRTVRSSLPSFLANSHTLDGSLSPALPRVDKVSPHLESSDRIACGVKIACVFLVFIVFTLIHRTFPDHACLDGVHSSQPTF